MTWPGMADDLQLSFDTVTRLICHQFEHNGWTTSCREGHRLLKLIFGGISDNKCIEDLHKHVRKKQKAGPNEKLTLCRIQKIVNEAPVISERRWKHTASVDRVSFLSDFRRSVKGFHAKNLCYPSKRHKLPPRFSRIMKKHKTWKALSEKTLAASSAGWAWVRVQEEAPRPKQCPIEGLLRVCVQYLSCKFARVTFSAHLSGRADECAGASRNCVPKRGRGPALAGAGIPQVGDSRVAIGNWHLRRWFLQWGALFGSQQGG